MLAAALVLLLPVVRGQLSFASPLQLLTCAPLEFTWSGGQGPFWFFVFPGDASSGDAIEWQDVGDSSSWWWTPDIGPGSPITIAIKDTATNEMSYSGVVTMEAGDAQDCVTLLGPAGNASFWATATLPLPPNPPPTPTPTPDVPPPVTSSSSVSPTSDPPSSSSSRSSTSSFSVATNTPSTPADVLAMQAALSVSKRNTIIASCAAGAACLIIILLAFLCFRRHRPTPKGSKSRGNVAPTPEPRLDLTDCASVSSATRVTPFPQQQLPYHRDQQATEENQSSRSSDHLSRYEEAIDFSSPPQSPESGAPFTPLALPRSNSRGSISSRSEKQGRRRPSVGGHSRRPSRASSISHYSVYSIGASISDDGLAQYNLIHDPAHAVTRPESAVLAPAGLAPINEDASSGAHERDGGRVINVLPPPYQSNWEDDGPREAHARDSRYMYNDVGIAR